MSRATLVAGDWGTSHLRLSLCDATGAVLDTASGPGASEARGHFSELFDSLVAGWKREHGELPALLSGMVGSSFGWISAPYLPCPVSTDKVASACVALRDGRVRIVPGVSCRNRLDAPDFMRGEETQILGALQLDPSLRTGRHLLCLPGTHTKWVLIANGSLLEFVTATTGELFALLCEHSILVSDARARPDVATVTDGAAFAHGLEQSRQFPGVSLLQRLFEGRSRRLSGELPLVDAASYISGILIGSDVASALTLFARDTPATLCLIGDERLTNLYATAIESQGQRCSRVEGSAASLAGLVQIQRLSLGDAR